MKTIARFDSPEEAHLFRSFLASRGIGATVLDEYMAQLFWHYRCATGGTRVVVDEEDEEAAESAKAAWFAALEPKPVTVARGWPVVALVSFFLGVPFLFLGRKNSNKDQAA